MGKLVKLGQFVDTLKLHLYHGELTTQKIYDDYVVYIENLKKHKEDAQAIHHTNNEMRFVDVMIGGSRFRVMATTFRGFSVTIKNADLSISLKSLSSKPKDLNKPVPPEEPLKLSPNPVIKIEFRASYLARVGHDAAIRFALRLIEHHVLSDYRVKVSEIHLATDVQGYDFNKLDFYRFRTKKRTNAIHDNEPDGNTYYYQGKKFTGFTFGTGDEMLRIYNKSVEIKKNPDKGFVRSLIWHFCDDYRRDDEVWRIEIQYRREKLKTIYDDVNGLLDGFESVMKSIPSLWNRALENVELTDMKDQWCLEHMLGYREEDGKKTPLVTSTVWMRIARAEVSAFWQWLKGWKQYVPNETNIYKAPKTAAFQWVSNSIKSLFSTLLRYEGNLSLDAIEDAFERAETECRIDKKMSLLDNAYANTLSYLGEVDIIEHKHGVVMNNYVDLRNNLSRYVKGIVRQVQLKRGYTFEENVTRLSEFANKMRRVEIGTEIQF